MCIMCILGHAETQNWFNHGDGKSFIPLKQVKVPFWDSYYNILTFYFNNTILFKNTKSRKKKKKKKKRWPLFSKILGRSEKGKQTSFFWPNWKSMKNAPFTCSTNV